MSYGTPPPGGPSDSDPTRPGDQSSGSNPIPPAPGQQPPAYGPPPTAYGQQPPQYGQQPPAYGQPPTAGGYGAAPPPMYGAPQGGTPPKNWLWLSIVTILFCWPLAIPAIIFSSQVNGKWAAGDAAGAQSSASKAKMFALIGIPIGIIALIINIAVRANS